MMFSLSNESFVRFNSMIETMNEQPKHSTSEMREFSLLYEIDPSLPFLRLEASLYYDCESSLLLESNFVDDTSLINLEEVFKPPVVALTFVTPSSSSTPIYTSVSDFILLVSFLLLAQCTDLKMGEPF